MSLIIEITSPPDREDLVAEIWAGDEIFAEVSLKESNAAVVEFYPRQSGEPWITDLDEITQALNQSKQRLRKAP
ncbi:hypothetical protein [Rhizobium yanglingense]